jgi:hypothetical protein
LTTFFPHFDINEILEREWWLMHHLNLGYNDIESMPWEYFDWFYDRHLQHLIDEDKKRNEQENKFG